MFKKIKIEKYFYIGVFISLFIVFVDQVIKWTMMENILRIKSGNTLSFIDWFSSRLSPEGFTEIFKHIEINKFLNLVMVWNRGISFGMFDSYDIDLSMVFITISIFVSILLFIWMALVKNKYMCFSLSLLIGGALSNVIDRIHFGAVVDFIDIHIGGYHWPAFNLADSFIAIGAIIMIFITFKDDEEKLDEEKK